jgi:hypothetical protein
MAYDLFYKKQIPANFSAHPSEEKSINPQTSLTLITLGIAFVESVLKKTAHEAESHHYQKKLRPGHHPTIEMPAMPMREMIEFGSN